MIINPEQAKEVGEALVDAAQRSVEDNIGHYVIYLDAEDKAVCLPVDPDIHSFKYNIIAHVTKPKT
tara:strand:- start:2706 stop:2903 length:198 start_codon:yes stop_codon:yes gene_type:complete